MRLLSAVKRVRKSGRVGRKPAPLMLRAHILISALTVLAASAFGGLDDIVSPSPNHSAIGYYTHDAADPVARLNQKLEQGELHLRFEGVPGYLRSVLGALQIPVESQVAVFSKTSFQAAIIDPRNPRTIFFNDSVAVGWMRNGLIEAAAQDPRQGIIFYVLEQKQVDRPMFRRTDACLSCHVSDASFGVPGMMVRSTFTEPTGMPRLLFGANITDHRSPLEERWGGWYATGQAGSGRHLGNALLTDLDHPEAMVTPATLNLATLETKFDTSGYLSPHSDIAALLVFNHQMHMMNLITRVGWEVRASTATGEKRAAMLRDLAREFVDYLLFVDEAPLAGKFQGSSSFAGAFAEAGPSDRQGRSLRQLRLDGKLMRYPCSYLIYSDAFEGMPGEAKEAIYTRLWEALSGQVKEAKYGRLPLSDRRAIAEILRQTKSGIPSYFQAVSR